MNLVLGIRYKGRYEPKPFTSGPSSTRFRKHHYKRRTSDLGGQNNPISSAVPQVPPKFLAGTQSLQTHSRRPTLAGSDGTNSIARSAFFLYR